MLRADPEISFRAALSARVMQAVFPLQFRLQYSSPEVQFATKDIAKPTKIAIPTRHGEIKALLYAPLDEDVAATLATGRRPPVHFITHGGGFIIRMPSQEDNVTRYLASELGAYVVIPDFDTAPTVRHPVSEQQAYDAFVWVHENGERFGWDGERVSIGGPSSAARSRSPSSSRRSTPAATSPSQSAPSSAWATSRGPTSGAPARRPSRWSHRR